MSNKWTGTGTWLGWSLDGDTLISPSGRAYKPEDIDKANYTQSDLAAALGVSRGAIADRLRRGTLPPFDDPDKKTWSALTVAYLFK
ncbi:hypothetical protein D3C74_310000 [compost metagenome]